MVLNFLCGQSQPLPAISPRCFLKMFPKIPRIESLSKTLFAFFPVMLMVKRALNIQPWGDPKAATAALPLP